MHDRLLRPGKPGFTTSVLAPWGRETYQVWLDERPHGWMARIVTLPNRVWALPGGREVLRFYGSTRDEAEGSAIRHIKAECLRTGRRIAPPLAADPASRTPALRPADSKPAPRTPRRLLVRFGTSLPERPGITANLSETGLFIITDRPAPTGAPVRIDLHFPDGPVRLDGEVVWTRQAREEGHSLGFGVRLKERPREYMARLRNLSESTVSP